jgi:CHASE2 domain-containing sensor protein/signal transduction histidine kinase
MQTVRPDVLRSALLLLVFTGFIAASGWLQRWDLLFYDLQMGFMSRAASDDIVIVAVDEKSLQALGRWPWSRGVHADMVDRLTQAGAKAIVFDILFAEPDRSNLEEDNRFIQSVAASERVFLPVILEKYRQGGTLIESMPMPPLANVAAGLGHVHIDLDTDGIARGFYLYEGIGQANWPHLMLSLLHWLAPEKFKKDHFAPREQTPEVQLISRRNHHLIPYVGPAGYYHRYSYNQVLEGNFLPEVFRDRIVLVGVTATGIGDALPTPQSGYGVPMSGVEINANILDSLRRGETISEVGYLTHLLGSALIVAVPFLLYPYFSTRIAPLVSLVILIVYVLFSGILLSGFSIWYSPAAGMVGLILSYPLWSWRRLDQAVRYLNEQLERLQQEQRLLPVHLPHGDMASAMQFLSRLLPLKGWVVYDADTGRSLMEDGEPLGEPLHFPCVGEWERSGAEIWTSIQRLDTTWQLGLTWPRNQVPQGRGLRLVNDFAYQFNQYPITRDGGVLERVELRLRQLRETTTCIQRFRNLIHNAVDQMNEGLIVINSHGQVVMFNPRGSLYLKQDQEADLLGEDAYQLLRVLEIRGGGSWDEYFKQVILGGEVVRFEAICPPDQELFVQLKSLEGVKAETYGMIVNISDIGIVKHTERTRTKMLNFLSHDIRSPITSLLSLTQSPQRLQGSSEALANEIRPLARRSLKLADDFLRLARAEAVKVATFVDLDFVSVASNALDEVYTQARAARISLHYEFAEEEVWVKGDPGLLERAVFNLLENAIKFSPPNSQVSMHIQILDDWVSCKIADQGPGLNKSQQQDVFQPFVQSSAQTSTPIKGVGLGLSFVKVVADKHHGRVAVSEREEGGALFVFSLPC